MTAEPKLLQMLLAEFVGTFCLVFFGCGAVAWSVLFPGTFDHAGIALTFGLVVALMVYVTGPISGAHLNPAVTLAFTLVHGFCPKRAALYWLAEFGGAIAAAFLLAWLNGVLGGDVLDIGVTQPHQALPTMGAWFVEIGLTAMLMFVISGVAIPAHFPMAASGLTIGGAVLLGALVGGPLTGASMNPARSLGPALAAGNFAHLMIYLVAPLIGAVIGADIYRVVSTPRDSHGDNVDGD